MHEGRKQMDPGEMQSGDDVLQVLPIARLLAAGVQRGHVFSIPYSTEIQLVGADDVHVRTGAIKNYRDPVEIITVAGVNSLWYESPKIGYQQH